MAAGKMTFAERAELHTILHWLRLPIQRPFEYYIKEAVRCYLDGVDPQDYLEKKGVPDYQARLATSKARWILQAERDKRRLAAVKRRLEGQTVFDRGFTYENFHDNMETSQYREEDMSSVSIYAVVEVWEDDDTVEKEYLVNFSDYKVKEWLTRLLVWGLMNKKEVLIKPATEVEMNSMRMFVPSNKDRE